MESTGKTEQGSDWCTDFVPVALHSWRKKKFWNCKRQYNWHGCKSAPTWAHRIERYWTVDWGYKFQNPLPKSWIIFYTYFLNNYAANENQKVKRQKPKFTPPYKKYVDSAPFPSNIPLATRKWLRCYRSSPRGMIAISERHTFHSSCSNYSVVIVPCIYHFSTKNMKHF